MKRKILLASALMFVLSGCQYLGLVDEVIRNNPDVFGTPKPDATATPAVQPTVLPTSVPTTKPTISPTKAPTAVPTAVAGKNPVCGTNALPSKAHLLWKPVSDTSGNAVVVFDGKYKEEFKEVSVELRKGGTDQAFWKGLELWGNPTAEGPRQHWRLRKKCAEYKDNALITAKDSKQTCVFKLEGTSCKRIE